MGNQSGEGEPSYYLTVGFNQRFPNEYQRFKLIVSFCFINFKFNPASSRIHTYVTNSPTILKIMINMFFIYY